LWLDIQHLRGFRSFTFDEPAFPAATLARLAAQGFRTVAIADPGIKVDFGWDVYDGGVAGDHFLHRADGPIFEGTAWPGASVFPDFSRPENGVPGQEPWMFGDEVTDVSRARLDDRYRLMPYLYSLADEAARTGAPILRPLVWEFPDDPALGDLGDQAMLGPYVLAAPIVVADTTTRDVYLPAGRWFELHSGAIFDGPTTIQTSITLAALPLYVREGAIIPTWPAGPSGPLELDVYPGAPTSFVLYEDDGESFSSACACPFELAAEPDGARLAITRDSAAPVRTLSIRVHRVDGTVTGVDGAGAFHHDPEARMLVASVADAQSLALRFRYDPAIGDPRPPVAVTFEVHVPTDTPLSPQIHVATSATGWTHTALAWVAPGIARGTVSVPRGEWLDYKFTRGSWETVEKRAGCAELTNRYRFGAASTKLDTVATWRDRCP